MSNLSTFAELMQEAARKKVADEAAEKARREKEVAPLLSELFKTVKTAKEVTNKEVVEKHDKVVELVKNLETQVAEAAKITQEPTSKESDVEVPEPDESAVMRVIKQLQKDFAALKQHVDSNKQQVASVSFGGGGSGEVQITRMDDVERATPDDGDTLVWDSSLGKFVYKPINSSTSEEDMPYAKRVDFVTDSLIYKGEAPVGSYDSDPVWRIHRLVLSADGDLVETWASGDASFSYSWTDRSTYPYQ
jgi:hypothetical protein